MSKKPVNVPLAGAGTGHKYSEPCDEFQPAIVSPAPDTRNPKGPWFARCKNCIYYYEHHDEWVDPAAAFAEECEAKWERERQARVERGDPHSRLGRRLHEEYTRSGECEDYR